MTSVRMDRELLNIKPRFAGIALVRAVKYFEFLSPHSIMLSQLKGFGTLQEHDSIQSRQSML